MSKRRPSRSNDISSSPAEDYLRDLERTPRPVANPAYGTMTAAERYKQRRNEYDIFGSPQDRRPYYEVALGRGLLASSQAQLLEYFAAHNFGFKMKPVQRPGVSYVDGRILAAPARFGLIDPDQPRLDPDAVIELTRQRLMESETLTTRANQEILDIPVHSRFSVRPWGRTACRLLVTISDPAASQNPSSATYIMQTEKFAVATKVSPQHLPIDPDGEKEYNHHITLFTAPIAAATTLREYMTDTPHQIEAIGLSAVGVIDSPQLKD